MNQLDLWKLLQDLLTSFVAVIPNLVGALAILIIGYIIAKVVARLIRRLLMSIGADHLADRLNEIDLVHRSKVKFVPSIVLSKVVYYFLLLVFIIAATDVLNMKVISELMGNILNYVPVVISALAVLLIGLLVSDFLKGIVKTTCDSLGIPAAGLIANIVFYFLLLNVLMIALSQAQIDTGFIQDNLSIILAGIMLAFAIGYGFASRSIVANFLASFYNRGKIKLGDEVEIAGAKGKVISLDNATMTLEAGQQHIIVPLSKLADEHITITRRTQPPV